MPSLLSLGTIICRWYSKFVFSAFVCLCEYMPWGYQEPNSDPLEEQYVLLTSELSDDTQDSFVDKQIRAQRI